MSFSALLQGQRSTVGVILTTTAETAVYTSESGEREAILGISIANTNASSAVTAKIDYNDGTTDYTFVEEVSIAAKATQIYDFPFAFKSSGSIKVTAGSANDLHVLVSLISTVGTNA